MSAKARCAGALALVGAVLCLAGCVASPEPVFLLRPLRVSGNPRDWYYKPGTDRPLYVIAKPFEYCYDKTGDVITVPRGFVTDLASIPSPVSVFLKPDGPYAQAAIVHDYLYAGGSPGDDQGQDYANDVLCEAMKDYKVGGLSKALVCKGVLLASGVGLNNYGDPRDWMFYDLRELRPLPAQALPPRKLDIRQRPDHCAGFAEWVRNRHRGSQAWSSLEFGEATATDPPLPEPTPGR
jgi:hypothetical protein